MMISQKNKKTKSKERVEFSEKKNENKSQFDTFEEKKSRLQKRKTDK